MSLIGLSAEFAVDGAKKSKRTPVLQEYCEEDKLHTQMFAAHDQKIKVPQYTYKQASHLQEDGVLRSN